MPHFDTDHVRQYYDGHTSTFIALGDGGDTGTIHRAVWAPGVASREAAFHYVDDQIGALARRHSTSSAMMHIVDLGCGVAASLCHIATHLPIRGTGVTLSPVQARLATERIRAAGLADRLTCVEGDYCNLPAGIDAADVAYAIESFVHAPSASAFFEQCRRLVAPGGILAICDDFRPPSAAPNAAQAIEAFRRGWRVNSLVAPDELRALARAAGFRHESTVDLTPYLELRRPRDRAIDVMLSALDIVPGGRESFAHLRGGSALQACLANGWVTYEIAVFQRAE